MGQPTIQPSFAAGELAPSLFARVDLAKFHVGLAKARNFYIDYRGGASNRTGTMAIGRCKQLASTLTPPRNIPFTFSTVQTYALEFGDQYMRVIMNGGYVLEPSEAIAGITNYAPGTFNIPNHGFNIGDQIYISGVYGMTQVNSNVGLQFIVLTVPDGNHVTFSDLDGNRIDTDTFLPYTGGGAAARVFTLVTPYAAADLPLLKYSQSADVMTLTHPNYAAQQLKRSAHWVWTITPYTVGASVTAPTGLAVHASNSGTTGYRYCVTAVAANGGTESLPSSAADTLVSAIMSQTSGANVTVTWNPVTGAQSYNVYRQYEIANSIADPGQMFGFVGNASDATFVDANILPDMTQAPPLNFNPLSGANPGCSTYYQQRQVFAGATSAPETMNFSKTGDFTNYDFCLPSRANDGIVATIASDQVNAVKHLVSMNSLIALSGSGAWKIDGGSVGSAITPSTITATPQAYNGCSDVRPIVINYDILYVQAKGSIVRDLTYNFYVNLYTGNDMTALSNHLFFGHQIVDWAWQEEPFKIVWAIRDDGILLSFTFLKEQDVYAWAHHDTQGKFRSVCSISEGNENAIYFIVERFINGKYVYMQERLASRNMGSKPELGVPADLSKAWFVDCGLTNALNYPQATLTPAAASATPSIVAAKVINGGQNYTNPSVIDLGDSGAAFSATVVGGVITALTPTSGGVVSQQPMLEITDATGSGAVAQAIVSNDVVMTTDIQAFNSGMVGWRIRVNDGWGDIRVVNSQWSVTVNLLQPLSSTWRAPSGSWSCTAPISTVTGLNHLEGETVSILADGSVAPQQVVTKGQITLSQPASSIFVGLPYISQLQSLYLDIPGESPTVQGKRKKISALTVRVADSVGIRVGTDFDNMTEMKERNFQPMGAPILPFTGDERIVLDPLYSVTTQLCLEQPNPLPSTVLGFIPEVTVGDTQ